MERRLLAILAADVVDYSRLMNADEAGTLHALRRQQKELIQPLVAGHGGRVVKLMGDGVLAEFASVVQAVACAAELQRRIAAANAALPPAERLRLRIGVNLGDVMVEEGDIYGDGVNIASRLQQLADPGGICLSASAHDQVKHQLRLAFRDGGEHKVKNIADPVRVFRLDPGEPAPAMGAAPSVPLPAGGGEAAAPPAGSTRDRPGIIVLPFDNLSADAEQDFFCDGLTNDITTDLSRFSSLFVIAANTAFTYKGRPARVEEVARELNVRYVLEGSVQSLGERVRINAQLIDAAGGHHLWAQRFDRKRADLFAVQDEMLRLIVHALAVKVGAAERERAQRKHPASVTAYEAYLRGTHAYTTRSAPELAAARAWFEKAVALDPFYARAWGALAYVSLQQWLQGWAPDSTPAEAERQARRAVELDAGDYLAHSFLGFCCLNAGDFEVALAEYERAYELNPHDAELLSDMAEALVYAGRHGEALTRIRHAIELSPHTPETFRWNLGWVHYFLKDYGEAVAALRRIPHPQPEVRLLLAAALARAGEAAAAAAEMRRFRKDRPAWDVEAERRSVRFRDPADEAHWLDGARLAGLPEGKPAKPGKKRSAAATKPSPTSSQPSPTLNKPSHLVGEGRVRGRSASPDHEESRPRAKAPTNGTRPHAARKRPRAAAARSTAPRPRTERSSTP